MEITLVVILSYVSNYLLSFVISLIGAFTTEMMTAIKKKSKIKFNRLMVPSIFDGFLMCAALEYFKLDFPIYVFVCFMAGVWGLRIVEFFTSDKVFITVVKSFLKTSSSALAKAAGEGVEVMEKESKTDTKDNKDTKEEDKDDSSTETEDDERD